MLQSGDKAVEARLYWITSSDIHAEIRDETFDVGVMLDELTTLVDMSDWPMLRERAARLRDEISTFLVPALGTGTGA